MEKVSQYIIENNLLQKGDKVLVALSGGPDSVCLLHILCALKGEFGIEVGAIHINHLLRAEDSMKDEEYTKELCNKLDIEYFCKRIDIEKIASEKNISLELAGREERYRAFEEIKKAFRYNKIAVAHNANDQAETVLMRIMRGTGLEGLTSIKVKREGGIIRPILGLVREEIEAYCEKYDLKPVIDKSNYEKIYNRNKVRLDILPYMKENFNQDIIETLNRMVALLQKDNEFIEGEAEKAFRRYCINNDSNLRVSKELFENEQEAIITRVIKKSIKVFSNNYENFEMKHIYDVIALAKKQSGKAIHLTNNILVENSYEELVFKKRLNKGEITNNEINIDKLNIPASVEFSGENIIFEVLSNKNKIKFSNNDLIKYFDYDKIKKGISIRTRKNGDKIIPLGMKGSKKLKDIFIDLKIPREKRDIIPIFCFDDRIAWIAGCKVSEEFKVTSTTKEILKISLDEREEL